MGVKRFKLTFTVQSISLKGHKWNLYFAWRKMCEMVSISCAYLNYTHCNFTVWSSVNRCTAEVHHIQGFCMCVASLYRGCIDKPSSLSVSLCILQKKLSDSEWHSIYSSPDTSQHQQSEKQLLNISHSNLKTQGPSYGMGHTYMNKSEQITKLIITELARV